MKLKFKPGDKVILEKKERILDKEGADWAEMDHLVEGKQYTVEKSLISAGIERLNLAGGYIYTHPASKFRKIMKHKLEDLKSKNVAIRIYNQEQLDLIRRYTGVEHTYRFEDISYPNSQCVNLKDGCYCNREYYEGVGYEVIDFSDLDIKENKKLPEVYWVDIRKTSREQLKEFATWYNKEFGTTRSGGHLLYRVPFSNRESSLAFNQGEIKGEVVITFEQWKKENMKETTGKKIIGYKSPYDLFDGNIKAGAIFKPITKASYKTDEIGSTQYTKHLPKEIVERWEPVYEEEKIMVGTHTCTFHEPGLVTIGCQRFNKSEVQFIHRLLTEFNSTIRIHGNDMTISLVSSILKQIK